MTGKARKGSDLDALKCSSREAGAGCVRVLNLATVPGFGVGAFRTPVANLCAPELCPVGSSSSSFLALVMDSRWRQVLKLLDRLPGWRVCGAGCALLERTPGTVTSKIVRCFFLFWFSRCWMTLATCCRACFLDVGSVFDTKNRLPFAMLAGAVTRRKKSHS